MDAQIIIETALIFLLGIIIGSRISAAWMRLTMRELFKDLGITDEQLREVLRRNGVDIEEPTRPEVEVRIERHQGVLFAYRCDTEEFLGQGSSQGDLVASITRRLQGVRLVIREENGADLLQKNNA